MRRRTFLIGGALALYGGIEFATASSPKERRGLITNTRSKQIGIAHVLSAAVEGGFTTRDQLLAVLAVGVAESSLWSAARKWHPEYGYRPITDAIGVRGPPDVWKKGRQMNSDRGIWQISSHWWPKYADADCDDVARAAHLVFDISEGGRNFRVWDPFNAGSAQRHYDVAFDGWPALRPLVDNFLAQGMA
jgi:hypothetical protein